MGADVQRERRLAHRGTGGDDDKIGGLQSGGQLVDVGETGRHAGNRALYALQPLDRAEAGLGQLGEGDEPGVDTTLRNGEDLLLGTVENDRGLLPRRVSLGLDTVRRRDQVAECGALLDDPRVVLDVGRARHAIGEGGDVGRTANRLEIAGTAQLVAQRDQVDGLTPLVEVDHLVEDAAVGVTEEVVGVDQLRRHVERVVADQNRAQDGPLRLQVVGKRLVARGDGRLRHVSLHPNRRAAGLPAPEQPG